METSKAMEKFMAAITLPGFTKRIETASYYTYGPNAKDPKYQFRQVVLENTNERIRFEINFTANKRGGRGSAYSWYGPIQWNGHTSFYIDGRGEVTFDRTGVEDSFTGGTKPGEETLEQQLQEQLVKIAASRERARNTKPLPAPLGSWHRTDAEVAELKKQLRSKGYIQFTPSGFGTGYTITTRQRSRWAKPAGPELVAFFGVGMLYYETMDCD